MERSAEDTGNQAQQNQSPSPANYRRFIMKVSSSNNNSSGSGSPERSSTPSSANKRQNASTDSTTPKMETPLWILLQNELLKAPKKTVKMLRRNSTTNSPSPSGRARSRQICKDLFGAKTDVQIPQVRG